MKRKEIRYIKIILMILIMICINNNAKANNEITDSSVEWKEWQKEEFWEWHTRTTTDDKAYNGKHIVIQNDTIDFYGYGENSYKDFLYKEYKNPGKRIFQFRLDEEKANYHTLDGAGFIFNAEKENNKLSGYILLFMQRSINLYNIKDININEFETTPNKTISDYGELIKAIQNTNSKIHDLRVEATPNNIKVIDGEKELINEKLEYEKHAGESFGLISSYTQHDCNILSKIEFSELKMTIEDYGVKVINTDTEDNIISGGIFEIKDENGNAVGSGKTDKNGMLYITGIYEGNYTLQQKQAPNGYILNDQIYKFKIDSDGNIISEEIEKDNNLIIKNEKVKEEIEINTENNIIENNIIENNTKIDNTRSNKIIPNAGNKMLTIVMLILLGIGISTFLIIKLKEYKDIK